ncbi:MAG: hypothetical protein GW858_00545 [Sphingomonadales bacterium]|nr:hypothetical protein [Sphingomonadales bacterium]NCQ19779.1 hypothetical protein [Sphingomonadales bacterium]NCT05038.1 hypothetical protein [Sphingomonadales bacterium]
MQFTFEAAHVLDRAHQAHGAIGRTTGIDHRPQIQGVPALAFNFAARVALGASDDGKLRPTNLRLSGQGRFHVITQKGGMSWIGQVRNVRQQQGVRKIETQFGNVGRCVNYESAPVEPDHDVTGRFFQQTLQDVSFDVT